MPVLDSMLKKYGIHHIKGGHNDKVGERIEQSMLPFFSESCQRDEVSFLSGRPRQNSTKRAIQTKIN